MILWKHKRIEQMSRHIDEEKILIHILDKSWIIFLTILICNFERSKILSWSVSLVHYLGFPILSWNSKSCFWYLRWGFSEKSTILNCISMTWLNLVRVPDPVPREVTSKSPTGNLSWSISVPELKFCIILGLNFRTTSLGDHNVRRRCEKYERCEDCVESEAKQTKSGGQNTFFNH